MKEKMKNYILAVFQNTDIDEYFILFANELGYADYFTNLKSLDDMTISELTICFERVKQVKDAIITFINKYTNTNN
jgi:hypothetical protein